MSEDRARQIRLQTARELEERGHVDKAVSLYLKAGAPGEAARLLVSKERYRDAGQLMIDALGVLPDDAGKLEGPQRNAAAKAARCFALGGDSATADRILRALGLADAQGAGRPSMPPDVLPRTEPQPSIPRAAPSASVPPGASATSGAAARASVAPSSVSSSSVPASSVPSSGVPASTVSASTVSVSTVPSSTVPASTVPSSTVPSSSVPASAPRSSVAPSSSFSSAVPRASLSSPAVASTTPSSAPRPSPAPASAQSPSATPSASARPPAAPTGAGRPSSAPRVPAADPEKWGRAAGWKTGQVDPSALDKAIQQLLDQGKPGQAARVAWDAGRLEDAARWFAEAGFDYETGSVMLELDRVGEAIERLVRVPADHKRHRSACAKLVDAAHRLDRFDFEIDRALARFAKAPPIEASELPTYLRLADLYARHGFADGARRALEQILLFDPAHPGAKAALERVAPPAPAQRAAERAARPQTVAVSGTLPELPPIEQFVALARKHAPAKSAPRA